MKYYINKNKELFGVEQEQEFLVKSDWVECIAQKDGLPYSKYNADGTPDSEAIQAEQEANELAYNIEEAKRTRINAMLAGATYSLNNEDYQISFTKEDGDGLVQVKSAFELGLTQTTIHFSNSTKMPISSSEFPAFALWFVNKRNEFFL